VKISQIIQILQANIATDTNYYEREITKAFSSDLMSDVLTLNEENIIELVPYYLPAALKMCIDNVQKEVYELKGIFIPAHIDRPVNGLFGQLGFIPVNMAFDVLSVLKHSSIQYVEKHSIHKVNISFLRNYDAHYIHQIGEICNVFNIHEKSFAEIKMALNQVDGRFVEINEAIYELIKNNLKSIQAIF
jgi:hypothetical protein